MLVCKKIRVGHEANYHLRDTGQHSQQYLVPVFIYISTIRIARVAYARALIEALNNATQNQTLLFLKNEIGGK